MKGAYIVQLIRMTSRNLIEHLVPSLENQIAEVIQPLKQDILHLEDKITETDMRTDDLEQYGRRHSLRISGIPECVTDRMPKIKKKVSNK
jgi:hypothetical protein